MAEPTRQVKLRRFVVAVTGAAAMLGACTSATSPASSTTAGTRASGSESTTAPVSSTTVVVATTLPVPVEVFGTSRTGALAFLGPVNRVPVSALAPGESTLPPAPVGSPASAARVSIAYRRFGSGRDLLLIGGQDASLATWPPQLLADLAGRYKVTVFDLAGAGYSGTAKAPLSLAWMADVTAGLSATLGLVRPVVLGWGLGGQVAIALAERHAPLVASLVLADTSAGGAGAVQPRSSTAVLLATPGTTPTSLSAAWFPADPPGQIARVAWIEALSAGAPDWLTRSSVVGEDALQSAAWVDPDLAAGLGSLDIPVLVVTGSDDRVFPLANSVALAKALPHARLVTLADAGYAAMFEDESSFVQSLEGFTR